VKVDVDELACYMRHPTVYNGQARGQSILTDAAPSRSAAMSGAPSRVVRGPRDWIFDVMLNVRVPERSNLESCIGGG
jgi:hypothetical protein